MPNSNRKKQRSWPETSHLTQRPPLLDERNEMDSAGKPSVLMLYYSYTHQTEKVMETMAEVLRDRGCATTLAAIEFSDPRYEKRFKQFPMPRPFLEVVAMIPAESATSAHK